MPEQNKPEGTGVAHALRGAVPELLLRGSIVVTEHDGMRLVGVHSFLGETPEGSAGERAKNCFSAIAARNDSSSARLYTPACMVTGMGAEDSIVPMQFEECEPSAVSRWVVRAAD